MAQEWLEMIKEANKSYKEQKYSQASGLFRNVLKETRKNIRQVFILSDENIHTVQEFVLCSRVAANAFLKNGQLHVAENLYLQAIEGLKPFISNLNNQLVYRSLVLTEFKLLFYNLADFYQTNDMPEKLETFVQTNQLVLHTWANDREMLNLSRMNLN